MARQIASIDTLRARAEELTAGVVADLGLVASTFWSIGEKLHELVDQRLYRALGYSTFAEYVEARLDVAIAQAYKMVRVVRSYTRVDAERIGLERAVALIPYAKLVRTDPGLLVREDARIGDVPVSEASRRHIERAAAERRAAIAARRARAPAARQAKRDTRRAIDGVRGLLAEAGIGRIKVEHASGDDAIVVRIPRRALLRLFPG
ncbi:MAG: hypothetical protein U1F43_15725 [Myxococcota bacterium]